MKRIKNYFTIVIALLCFTACTKNSNETKNTDDVCMTDSATLRIAVMPTLDCLPLYVAEEEGMFERQGINVRLCPYQAQMDCDTAIQKGRIDIMVTDLVRAEYLKKRGLLLRYLTATDLQWQLLAGKHTHIKRLGQLENKMVAMTRYSATAMLTDELVDSALVTNEHVFRIQINDLNVRFQMLETEVMDAMFLPEPQATAARLLGAEVLYDTEWNDVCMGVMIAQEKTLADTLQQRQTEGLLKAYNEACDTINSRGVRYYSNLLAIKCALKDGVADSLPSNYHFSGVHLPRAKDVSKATVWLNK